MLFVSAGAVRAQNKKIPQSKGLQLLVHLDLKEYATGGSHDKFSHGCTVAAGNERYAAVGTLKGTVVFRYTDYVKGGQLPVTKANKKDMWFFPGANSLWRECRGRTLPDGTGRVYVVTEGMNHESGLVTLDSLRPGGIQIIKVEAGKAPILTNTFIGQFNAAHTIALRDNFAFVNGASWRVGRGHQHFPLDRSHLGGMRILDLTDPDNPRDLGGFGDFRNIQGIYPAQYTHDSYAYGHFVQNPPVGCDPVSKAQVPICPKSGEYIVYSADIYFGLIRVLDVQDPANVVVLDSVRTYLSQKLLSDPSARRPNVVFTHNVWVSENRQWLFATEELKGSGISVFYIGDPMHPKFVTHYRSPTVADSSVAHNVYVRGDSLYVSWYTEGVHVIDIADPAHPKEVAWYDTSDEDPNGPGGPFQGNWSVVVDADGNIIIVDMQSGLYILRPKP